MTIKAYTEDIYSLYKDLYMIEPKPIHTNHNEHTIKETLYTISDEYINKHKEKKEIEA